MVDVGGLAIVVSRPAVDVGTGSAISVELGTVGSIPAPGSGLAQPTRASANEIRVTWARRRLMECYRSARPPA